MAGTMKAVVTTGTGGYDNLDYRDVPVPTPRSGEALIRVLAAGINNTDINTRLGWYSQSPEEPGEEDGAGGGWNRTTSFPLIQGTDCCGVVEAVGPATDASLVGRRVLVRPCVRTDGFESMSTMWMGSDFDGAFAEYVRVPVSEAFPIDSDWSDAELGSMPCAFGTAENMLRRAGVGSGDHVLVTGASGGVGSAAVQLAKSRGARVTAVSSASKAAAVRAIGADHVVPRDAVLANVIGTESVDVAVDNVAGPGFGAVLDVIRRGGRYVSSGAVAGPMVSLDMRELYLKDRTIIGSTAWDEPVFPALVAAIEANDVTPVVAGTYRLADIGEAQRVFLERRHIGKLVLIPPGR